MRSFLAHVLRWSARWQLAVSNRLLPPRELTPEQALESTFGRVNDRIGEAIREAAAQGADETRYRLPESFANGGQTHEMGRRPRVIPPMTATYTGGPEGPAARQARLREEC